MDLAEKQAVIFRKIITKLLNCKYTTANDVVCETSARDVNVWLTEEEQGNWALNGHRKSFQKRWKELNFQIMIKSY